LMFFSKLHRTDNIVLRTLIHVPMVKYEMSTYLTGCQVWTER